MWWSGKYRRLWRMYQSKSQEYPLLNTDTVAVWPVKEQPLIFLTQTSWKGKMEPLSGSLWLFLQLMASVMSIKPGRGCVFVCVCWTFLGVVYRARLSAVATLLWSDCCPHRSHMLWQRLAPTSDPGGQSGPDCGNGASELQRLRGRGLRPLWEVTAGGEEGNARRGAD